MQELLTSLSRTQAIALVIGLAIFLSWESLQPFFGFYGRASRERFRHGALNLVLGALNSLAVTLAFVSAWLWAAEWAYANEFGLLNLIDGSILLPTWLRVVFAVLLLDAWTYTWHRLNHRSSFLWRFHRVHHSDRNMDVTTATRFHIGEIVLSSALRLPIILLFGVYVWELVLYETVMFAVVQFHHANIAVPEPLDRLLRIFVVTPNMHKVHHSRVQVETDSNYSALLSIWDRIGRSFRMRKPAEIQFGLDEFSSEDSASFATILKMPIGSASKDDGS
ncbi:MAG: sterol desaturase family protein [Rhodothermales bacterium]|nr:sterol desaturase family protein [Rhodothermales bacterium]